jgi:GNAT superfamily N-acetyltransferase
MAMKKLIKDRYGRVLEFSQERVEDLVYFKLDFFETCAAYVNCQIEGDVLVLADIFVEDQCVVRHPSLLFRLFGRKTLEVNFRRQGIGSQLLTTVMAYTKSKGLRRLEYRMSANDPAQNPELQQWFRKRGFTVTESTVFKDLERGPKNDSRYMPKG